MKFHEYAEIYRMLSDEEISALAQDISKRGQLIPIVLYQGQILDGRNRFLACQKAGVTPEFREYTGDDPIGQIAALNDHRRHDSPGERALVGARMANLRKGGAGGYKTDLPPGQIATEPAVSIERAAELTGTSVTQIVRARDIIRKGKPEIEALTRENKVSLRVAATIASLPSDEQEALVIEGTEAMKKKAQQIRRDQESKPRLSTQSNNPPSDRLPKYIQSNGLDIWLVAKSHLDRIADNDTQFQDSMNRAIDYCNKRLSSKSK
jgi:predicted HTH domain antitoxin